MNLFDWCWYCYWQSYPGNFDTIERPWIYFLWYLQPFINQALYRHFNFGLTWHGTSVLSFHLKDGAFEIYWGATITKNMFFIHLDMFGHLNLRISKSMIETLTRTHGIMYLCSCWFHGLHIYFPKSLSTISRGKGNDFVSLRGTLLLSRGLNPLAI